MSGFRFKHFTVRQENAALKVGTDSMLLGSLCDFTGKKHILDIGTGTGVLPLMIAQQFSPQIITAVEIDENAVKDAGFNFAASPFTTELRLVSGNITDQSFIDKFDGIISNPPYFENSTRNTDQGKKRARHTDELDFGSLVSFVSANLSADGIFWIVLPHEAMSNFIRLCLDSKLYPQTIYNIEGKPGNPVRTVVSFTFQEKEAVRETITVRDSSGNYTAAYIALTREFHGTNLSAAVIDRNRASEFQ